MVNLLKIIKNDNSDHQIQQIHWPYYDAFTLDVKSVLNENLGGILGGTQC
jgi:hypothetical protein